MESLTKSNYTSTGYSSMGNTGNTNTGNGFFSNKNILIIVLVILLFLSILGINILKIFGNIIESLTQIFGPLVVHILAFFGYTTGTIINKTADVVTDTAKVGLDIAEGTVQDIGNILINSSSGSTDEKYKTNLENALNLKKPSSEPPKQPEPTPSENPIQKPITANKTNWCLVGEYMGRRGCIEINENDKCLSGQVFPTNAACLNPNVLRSN